MRRGAWPMLLVLGSALSLGGAPTVSRAQEEAQPPVQEQEQIHECKDASGNVIFQHDPCPKKRHAPVAKDEELTGCDGHGSPEYHERIANDLAAVIQDNAGW